MRSVYLNEYKAINENKNTANNYIYFPESNFVVVSKTVLSLRILFTRRSANNCSFVISGKKLYDQPIVSDITQYEEIR